MAPSSLNIQRTVYRITQIGAIETATESDHGVVGLLDERQKRLAWPSWELLNNARWNPFLIY